MKQYVVDAFTREVFRGNPAAVCVMKEWLPDEMMQKIAIENQLSETAFAVKQGGYVRTPLVYAGRRNQSLRTCHAGDGLCDSALL